MPQCRGFNVARVTEFTSTPPFRLLPSSFVPGSRQHRGVRGVCGTYLTERDWKCGDLTTRIGKRLSLKVISPKSIRMPNAENSSVIESGPPATTCNKNVFERRSRVDNEANV